MPKVVFPLDSTKKFTDQADRRPQPLASGHPRPGARQARRRRSASTAASGSTARSTTTTPPTTSSTRRCPACTCSAARSPCRGRRARRPADRRHPRRRPDPAGGLGPAGRAGLGLHRRVRHEERRRLPHRAVPRRLQGDLGLHAAASRPRGTSPGVSYTGIVHPGLMGTAPSAELLAKWNARETGADRHRPGPGAAAGAAAAARTRAILGSLTGAEFDRVAGEAARTAPPRENGGNQDIKNFTKGTRVFYPVFVDGREPVDGRPALLPGRRRDHVLRRDRDGRVHGPARRPDQGRDGDLRRLRERDLHAGHDATRSTAEWLAFSGDVGRPSTASSTTWTRTCPTSGPACTPSTT